MTGGEARPGAPALAAPDNNHRRISACGLGSLEMAAQNTCPQFSPVTENYQWVTRTAISDTSFHRRKFTALPRRM